jgi:hypothetical protein
MTIKAAQKTGVLMFIAGALLSSLLAAEARTRNREMVEPSFTCLVVA